MPSLRVIPSIEQLLQRSAVRDAAERHGRDVVTTAARQAADELRRLVAEDAEAVPTGDAPAWLEARVLERLRARTRLSLRRVINATGVVIHTNLGRAPIAAEALANAGLAAGYSNLEYNLDAGTRGHRHAHAERLLCELTGAEAALVANNTAAAALLTLAALASGREVVVSRGELVEIGGGFRVPEILAQSGAQLREVGTTNRTRAADYAAAIGDRTAAMLRVHPSNFRQEGFTARPGLAELAALAAKFQVPLIEDVGSGWLGDEALDGALPDEPVIAESVRDGADLVLFSGDKLLGGPQAGIVVGKRDLVARLRRHPLMRAVRAGKLTYAVLESTLALWAERPSRSRVPVYGMLTTPLESLDARARGLVVWLASRGVQASTIDGDSASGGGSAPGSRFPTRLVVVSTDGHSAASLERMLRLGETPVVARIADDRVVLDLRTVAESESEALVEAIVSAVGALGRER